MIDQSVLQSVSGEAIHFAKESELAELEGVAVTHIKAVKPTKVGLMKGFASALRSDRAFGSNWDALLDSLRSDHPLVVVIHGSEALWAAAPHLCGELVETWLAAAEEARPAKLPRHLIFVW